MSRRQKTIEEQILMPIVCPACGGAGEETVLTTEATLEVRKCATCEGKGYVALNVSDLKVYVP